MGVNLLLIVSLFSLSTFSKIPLQETENSLERITNKLKNHQKEIDGLKKQLSKLEFGLTKYNDQYISNLKKIQKHEDSLEKVKDSIRESYDSLKKVRDNIRVLVSAQVLSKSANKERADDIVGNKVLKSLTSKNIMAMKKLDYKIRYMIIDAKNLEKRIEENKKTNEGLYSMLMELEEKKKDTAQQYISKLELQKKLGNQISKEKSSKLFMGKASKKTPIKMRPPILNFVKVDHKKKGVTFAFENAGPVLATASGKVSYTGNLSNYGKLVMINHGNDIRTVLLGNFTPKVEKGSYIKVGDVIGYTRPAGKDSKIYFEVRKKNIAQNTIDWLDRTSLFH